MNIDAEYGEFVSYLKESGEGEKIFSRIPEVSKKIYTYLSKIGPENSAIATALSYIQEKDFLELLDKNLVLIIGRALSFVKEFDSLDLQQKMEKVLNLCSIVKEEQKNWHEEYLKKVTPLHDKEERRKRRKELFANESSFEKRDKPLCEAFLQFLLQKLIPDGTNSLFLPAMAKLFLPKNFFESLVLKNIDIVMKEVHAREWKEMVLCRFVTFLFQDGFKSSVCSSPEEAFVASEALIEKGKDICSWLLHLVSIVDSRALFLPKEETTKKALEIAALFIQKSSLQKSLMKIITLSFAERVFMMNLHSLVDGMSGDPKTIGFLLKKAASFVMPLMKFPANPSVGEVLLMGIKEAAIDMTLQEKAEGLVYEEIPLKIFQQIHLFVLSPFFDRVIYRSSL